MTKIILLALSVVCARAMAADSTPKIVFKPAQNALDVFTVKDPGAGVVFNNYLPYGEWSTSQTGKFFPMEVSPVLDGMANPGGAAQLPPKEIDLKQYTDQAQQFAKVVNDRNKGGRVEIELKAGVPVQKQLDNDKANTYVVQTVLAGVVNRPFSQLKLSTEKFAAMAETIDTAHSYYKINGAFVLEALEKDHIAARAIDPNGAYLLSVVDFRTYGCAAMKNILSLHFSGLPEKKKLKNDSIYMISDLQMNNATDMDQATKFFNKKPAAILSQNVVYADHLLRGARTLFVFFDEGQSTRVVLISNLGMQKKYFVGPLASAKGYVLDGMGNGIVSAIAAPVSTANDLWAGIKHDVKMENSCDKGLGLGLIKYSESLFSEFNNYLIKN